MAKKPKLHPIEKELIEATEFELPKNGYPDPQDYYAALVKSIGKLSDDDYEKLSDDAANWASDASTAFKKKESIPNFDGEVDAAEPVQDEDDDKDKVDAESEAENEDEEAEAESDNEAEEAEEDAEVDKKAAKVSPPKTPPKKPKVDPKLKAERMARAEQYNELNVDEKDRFGIVIGTKTHEAAKMYEKGCTSTELREKLDGRFYNILKQLSDKGHRVERLPGGIFKLTHKDDFEAKPAKKGKK